MKKLMAAVLTATVATGLPDAARAMAEMVRRALRRLESRK